MGRTGQAVSARIISIGALVWLLAVLLLGAAVAGVQHRQAVWLLEKRRSAQVGMTEEDLVARLGPPALRVRSERDVALHEAGHWTSARAIEHVLLVWEMRSPMAISYRLYAYLDLDGIVTCAVLGAT
jgi:hypothetical protein